MAVLLWVGVALAVTGLVGLGWCLREALRVRRGAMDPETARKALARMQAVNLASVATAFLGLAAVAANAGR